MDSGLRSFPVMFALIVASAVPYSTRGHQGPYSGGGDGGGGRGGEAGGGGGSGVFGRGGGRGGGRGCSLDASWTGRWFEYGERKDIEIGGQASRGPMLSHKGECVLRKGDKYIFRDKVQGCYRCAVAYQKHANIIQYKESYCEHHFGREPTDLCRKITADSPLKSMFRLDASPEECPIQGSFQMTYSRGLGLCEYPKSSVSQCSDKAKVVFRYQACADIERSESSVEELQCLGSWKEGSTHYFLGLLNHTRVKSEDWEGRFRCFAYQSIHDGFNLAQSGEAKCNLYSAKEGDRTMTLKKVHNHEQTCEFPRWMLSHHHQFHNLNRTVSYHFNKQNTSLTITDDVSSDPKRLKCHSIVENVEGNRAKVIAQVNFECESGFVCLESLFRADNIMSLRLGRLSRNREEACHEQLFFDSAPKVTLISSKHVRTRCPLVGKFSTSACSASGQQCPRRQSFFCPSWLAFGCARETKFQTAPCATQDERQLEDFSCHGDWLEGDEVLSGANLAVPSATHFNASFVGLGAVEDSSARFVVISPASTASKRLCAKIWHRREDAAGRKTLRVLAKADECPYEDKEASWDFEMARENECAEALATANGGSSRRQSALSFFSSLFSLCSSVSIYRTFPQV